MSSFNSIEIYSKQVSVYCAFRFWNQKIGLRWVLKVQGGWILPVIIGIFPKTSILDGVNWNKVIVWHSFEENNKKNWTNALFLFFNSRIAESNMDTFLISDLSK
jgi:hypothetical protein